MSKLIGYTVKMRRSCEESEQDDDGSWEESWTNEFDSIKKSKDHLYIDVYSPVDLEKQDGFLVWVEYSHGDSFGCSNRGNVECIALLSSMERAEELEKQLQEWTDKKDADINTGFSDFNFSTVIDNQEIKIHAPWLGYFENLDSINIASIGKGFKKL